MVDGVLRDPVVCRTTERRSITHHGWRYTGLAYLCWLLLAAHGAAAAAQPRARTIDKIINILQDFQAGRDIFGALSYSENGLNYH